MELPAIRVGEEEEEDGTREFILTCRLKGGWHLSVGDETPAIGVEGVEVVEVAWPRPSVVAVLADGEELRGFEGSVEVRGRLRASADGGRISFRFEACGEGRCLPLAEMELGSI